MPCIKMAGNAVVSGRAPSAFEPKNPEELMAMTAETANSALKITAFSECSGLFVEW